jgi:capsular exopolysaccharide synthesis family protein
MNSPPKTEKSSGSGSYPYTYYGTSYGGYGYGGYGGYGSGGETTVQRTLQDYLLILRERAWYIVVVFLLVFSSAVVFTFNQVKLYQSVASVQIYRRDPVVMQVQNVLDSEIRSAEDLNTQVKVLESGTLIQRVADRLQGEDQKQFLAPYLSEGESGIVPSVAGLILKNRKIVPVRLSLVITVQFQHPNPSVAAKVANLFVDEYINFNKLRKYDETNKAVVELKEQEEQQQRRVEDLAQKLQAYREQNKQVSLDKGKDIVTETLKQLSARAVMTGATLSDAETQWKQVQQRRDTPEQLLDLPFITNQPLIGSLSQQVAAQKIVVAGLAKRYREKHPDMMKACNTLEQSQRELLKALDAAAAGVEANYQTAKRNHEQALAAKAEAETQSFELDRVALKYADMDREYQGAVLLLQTTRARAKETAMSSSIQTQNAWVVDRAAPSNKPVSPNIPLNLGLGLLGGLALGVAFAFFVAYIDDRVKSSFDIESVVGLPLIGINPEVKRMEQPDKAQVVANNADKQVMEAFLTLHSTLRLKDESKNAQCILTTSTIPGEGKSFTTTNLALTYAAHGERCIIVDCDLRKPNIHKSFRIENLKGVIDVVTGRAKIDDVIVRTQYPNCDVLPSGGRAKNPTQVLNAKGFEVLISDLRKRYDRIFIDTPPLAAVSDALIVLPLMDGSLFTIFFNRVRRKAAQLSARKMLEVNVPCFGAVLNSLNLAVSGYYYAQYYDKSYKDYYVIKSKKGVPIEDQEAR